MSFSLLMRRAALTTNFRQVSIGAASSFSSPLSPSTVRIQLYNQPNALTSMCCAPSTISLAQQVGALRWATSKSGGSTKNGRDSQPKYLGVKKYGGESVIPGNIILRQRGQKFGIVESTATVAFGKDFTIYALKPGYVKFWYHPLKNKSFVEVVPSPVGASPQLKYPIVKLKKGDIPRLATIEDNAGGPGSVAMSEDIAEKLKMYRSIVASSGSSGGVRSATTTTTTTTTTKGVQAAVPSAA